MSASDPRARRSFRDHGRARSCQGGITILEVIVALTVLSFLAGAIFMIVYGSTSAAAELERDRIVNRRIKMFIRTLEKTFHTMPANASVELRVKERDPLLQELVIREVPTAFVFGREPAWDYPEITIALRRVEAERLTATQRAAALTPLAESGGEKFSFEATGDHEPKYVGLSNPRFFIRRDPKTGEELEDFANPLVISDEQGRQWLELLPGIAMMEWRFYDAGKKKWFDERPAQRPPLIELLLTPKGHLTPMRIIFELP
jgi:hypothetical protein